MAALCGFLGPLDWQMQPCGRPRDHLLELGVPFASKSAVCLMPAQKSKLQAPAPLARFARGNGATRYPTSLDIQTRRGPGRHAAAFWDLQNALDWLLRPCGIPWDYLLELGKLREQICRLHDA